MFTNDWREKRLPGPHHVCSSYLEDGISKRPQVYPVVFSWEALLALILSEIDKQRAALEIPAWRRQGRRRGWRCAFRACYAPLPSTAWKSLSHFPAVHKHLWVPQCTLFLDFFQPCQGLLHDVANMHCISPRAGAPCISSRHSSFALKHRGISKVLVHGGLPLQHPPKR